MIAAILECDQKSIDLDGAVVMPDHAHLIFSRVRKNQLLYEKSFRALR